MTRLLLCLLLPALFACSEQSTDLTELSSYRGKTLVINYWAQWCTPCIKEIPELNALAGARPDVAVLGVNYDGLEGEELAAQVEELGVDFPTLNADPSEALGEARPMVLPTTFIVSPSGEVKATLLGPQTLDTLEAAIEP